ncbi:MAG: tRNA-dihydrouridine synthase [Deltaproteobacteria bacterium]|nr:MAG: tRNA-dihydrouridine synthase [Deltaproteobacteria bacterium]
MVTRTAVEATSGTREPTMHPHTTIGPRGLPTSLVIGPLRIAPPLILAPMEGVTDLPFRRLIRSIGGTGLTCTEFIPGAGLARGDDRWVKMAELDPDEHPVSIQIYGREPAVMAEAARAVQDLGADIVDINMGCPSRKVCAHSGGSALMREPARVAAIVAACRAAVDVPLTVKMRSGFDHDHRNAPELAAICESEGADAITIHWRTRADGYGGRRAVDRIAAAVDRVDIPVIGNGDVVDIASAVAMFRDTGCDGVMIGRGALADPWVFRTVSTWLSGGEPQPAPWHERAAILRRYLALCMAHFAEPRAGRRKRHDPARVSLGRFKQLARYLLADTGETRQSILRSRTIDEALAVLSAWEARQAPAAAEIGASPG